MKKSMIAILAFAAAVSCQLGSSGGAGSGQQGSGERLESRSAVSPELQPYGRAGLILAGTVIPVDLKREAKSDSVTFKLMAHGETVEEESYIFGDSLFSIASAAGESYQPAIPLLKFPMHVGDKWEWVGKMGAAEIVRAAKADVTSANENLNLPGVSGEAIKVNVRLQMDGGGPEPAVRNLTFWFVKGKGIVKREFGASSTRQPIAGER